MGWRETVGCRPLFGNQDMIDKFNKKYPDGVAYIEGYKHDPTSWITEQYPDVVFYGLYIFDNTCGEFTYRNIVFCNDNCCDIRGKSFYNFGGEVDVPIDEDLTIVARDDRDYRPYGIDHNKSLIDAIQDILNLAKEFNEFDYNTIIQKKWYKEHPEEYERLKKQKEERVIDVNNFDLPF